MRKTIEIIFILILFFSCKKEDFKHEFVNVVGDYEWYYSYRDIGDSYTKETETNKYGIRVKENSKLFIFKNDDLIYKGIINNSAYWENETIFLVSESNKEKFYLEFHNDELSVESIPFGGYKNYFKKVK